MFITILQNPRESTCVGVSFNGLKTCNFIKIDTPAQVFSCEFCGISKSTFFYRTPQGDCFCVFHWYVDQFMKFASRWPFSAFLGNIFSEAAFSLVLFNKLYDERKLNNYLNVHDLFWKKSTRTILFVLSAYLSENWVCLKSKHLQLPWPTIILRIWL